MTNLLDSRFSIEQLSAMIILVIAKGVVYASIQDESRRF